MESSKSFSIDALLSRDKPKSASPCFERNSPGRRTPQSRPSSPADSRDSDRSTPSPNTGSSTASHFIPRPGLLNTSPLTSGHLVAGLYPGHPLYAYNGSNSPHGHGPHSPNFPLIGSSAFHNPTEQALKAAQAQGMPLEWLARTGLFMPRMMDYPETAA